MSLLRAKISRFYRSAGLRFRLTAVVLTVAVVVLIAATAYIGNLATVVIESKSTEQLEGASRTLSTAVSIWLETHQNILRNLVSLPDIISMDPNRQKPILERMGASYPYMYLVSTTNMQGINVARNDNLPQKDYSDRDWFKKVKNGADVTFESLISRTVTKPALAVSMPIRDKTGNIIGVGMFSLNLENLANQVRVTQVGKTGFAYIVDGTNRVIAHPSRVQFTELLDLSDYQPVAQLRKGVRGNISFTDVSGQRWRAFISEMDNGWGIVVQQQEEELLSTRRMLRQVSLWSIIAAVLVLTTMTWWVVRRSLRPIEVLTKAVTGITTDRLSKADLDDVLKVSRNITTNDEIGALAEGFSKLAIRLQTTLANLSEELAERKLAEETVRTSNDRLRSVLRAATAYSIIGTDPDGVIKLFNEGATLMLGYSADEVIDKTTMMLFHDPAEVIARANELGINPGFEVFVSSARVGETETREWTYIRKDGSKITVSLTVTAMLSEESLLTGFIGVARDISNEKKMEQQLIQSQKMETVGLLAGGVAHDFNNILSAIIGYAYLMQQKLRSDDPMRDNVEQILESANRAAEITSNLLAFSRKQVINARPVNINDIITKIEKLLSRIIGEDIDVGSVFVDREIICMADAGQIEQVLLNLATNARDAMPYGGRLTIRTELTEIDDAFIRTHGFGKAGAYALITVSDTGTGMKQEEMEKVFEPFFTTKETGKGTGLGLAMAYGIIKQHDGYISVESQVGKGTSFSIYLPVTMSKEDVSVKSAVEPMPEGGTETILVAEDDERLRSLSEIVLTQANYKVILAQNGEEAIEKFIANKDSIDLVLLDMIMPKKSGTEVYEEIKSIKLDIKVIFLSGYTADRMNKEIFAENHVNFIFKPVAPKDLLKQVRDMLDK